jgi:hypothetical protein
MPFVPIPISTHPIVDSGLLQSRSGYRSKIFAQSGYGSGSKNSLNPDAIRIHKRTFKSF